MTIDVFILIGGRSSRMGAAKATLLFEGESLTERAVKTARDAFPDSRVTLVAAGAQQFSTFFAFKSDVPFVLDVYQNRGPYGGIHAALANCRAEWALVLACDFPRVSSELLRRLASFIAPNIDAIVPLQPDGRVQPICALYRVKACLRLVEAALAAPRVTPPAASIAEAVATRYANFAELSDLPGAVHFFVNLNTPEDVAATLEHISGS